MTTKAELIDLFRSLEKSVQTSERDFALAALEYASTVLNRPESAPAPERSAPALRSSSAETNAPYDGSVRLCLDFGTAMSKAFAWDRKTDVPMPLKIGKAAGEPGSTYALNSTMFISKEGRVYFGQQAVTRAAAVDPTHHRPMDSIKDFLTVGSEFALTEPVSRENNPTRQPLSKKEATSLYLAFLTDNALLALAEDYGEPRRNVPRSYTKPVFDQSRDSWATDTLNQCANLAQVLADRLSGQWSQGIDLGEVRAVVGGITSEIPNTLLVDQHIIPEPVAAFASRLPDDVAEHDGGRRLCIVIDVGAGTTDFAAFAIVEHGDDTRTVIPVKHSVTTIRIAGDAVDNVLMDHLLQRAGITEGHSQIGAMRADLRRDIRLLKEDLYTQGTVRRQLVNDQEVATELDAFEQCEGMLRLSDAMRQNEVVGQI